MSADEDSSKSMPDNDEAKKQQGPAMARYSSVARGLKGLRFLDEAGKDGDSWKAVEKRFNQNASGGRVPKGMATSKEFAGQLFDTMARRRNIDTSNGISIDEMRLFSEDMTSQDIYSRLQIFFDMCDKDGDGKISEEEVKETWMYLVVPICLYASERTLTPMRDQSHHVNVIKAMY